VSTAVFRPESARSASAYRSASLVLVSILAALGLVYCLLPLASVIKIGTDEDFALSKALLSLKGFKMYIDYWNDQPPLHTFFLKFIFAHISYSVLAARLLTVASAFAFLSAVFFLILRCNGLVTAAVSTVLLVTSPGFLELSSSAMVEIPALAPVMIAICIVYTAPGKRQLTDILAGLIFAVALATKLIGALYLPLIAVGFWLRTSESPRATRDWVVSGLRFSAALAIGFIAINLLTGEAFGAQFAQSRASHFSEVRSYEYGSPADHPFQWIVLLRHWDTTVPAAAGLFLLIRRHPFREWALPCCWLALTFAVFTTFKPYWTYYYAHLAVPLSWLAAVAISQTWTFARNVKRPSAYGIIGTYALCASAWIGGRVYLQVRDIRGKPRTEASPVIREIEHYKPYASSIWATEPVYAFHVNMLIPPRLATLSLKRFWSGDMTNAQLAERMRTLHPEIVLLTNDGKDPPFQALLETDYRLVYRDSEHRLYVLPSVVERADPWPTPLNQ
jgi:hypothetical protein